MSFSSNCCDANFHCGAERAVIKIAHEIIKSANEILGWMLIGAVHDVGVKCIGMCLKLILMKLSCSKYIAYILIVAKSSENRARCYIKNNFAKSNPFQYRQQVYENAGEIKRDKRV